MGDTKRKILMAMEQLVIEKGYDRASMGELAERVNIKKASIYYHFATKEEIFVALVEGCVDAMYKSNEDKMQFIDTKEKYLASFLFFAKDMIEAFSSNPEYRKLYAEIGIQAERIEAIANVAKKSEKNLYEGMEKYYNWGKMLGALPKEFDVEKSSQITIMMLESSCKGTWKFGNFEYIEAWDYFAKKLLA